MQEENSQKVKIFSRRLRGLRSSLGITQSELAAKLGIALGTIGNWEAERNMPQGPLIRRLSEFFNVPVSFLLGEGADEVATVASTSREITLKEGASFYEGKERGHMAAQTRDPQAFWLEWFGDSMDPRVLAGDSLLVSPNAKVESGDLVMAKKTSGEIFVRIYISGKDGPTLVAYNSIYPAMECRHEDFTFIYSICQLMRVTKVRGLFEPEVSEG